MQLAALLEHSYRAQTLELDWSAWDGDWSAVDIHTIPPAAFWYWIALRHTPDACAPAALRDAQSRTPGPVLLVDDLADSRWTLTVAARELRLAGAPAVLPLVLALEA